MRARRSKSIVGGVALAVTAAASTVATVPAVAQTYAAAVRASSGTGTASGPSTSSDGRLVAFTTDAAIDPADTNGATGATDAYVFDRAAGTTVRASVATGGGQGSGATAAAAVSADGRFVAFTSAAPDLVVGDTNGATDVFVRDLQAATTERVSVATGGAQGSGASGIATARGISADGRYVAFTSAADDLVVDDVNLSRDVFVRDRQLGTTERVSTNSDGDAANGPSDEADISADGDVITFSSSATNIFEIDANGQDDVFVHRRSTDTTDLVSRAADGTDSSSGSGSATVSADGTVVAFTSRATDLVAGDTNGVADVFTRTLATGTTERISVSSSQAQSLSASSAPSISADGRHVAFASAAQLVALDDNPASDVFVRDRARATTSLGSRAADGGYADGPVDQPAISSDGLHLAFASAAAGIVADDPNPGADVFAIDAGPASIDPFTSILAFVKQQYLDFALRAPTSTELAADTTALANGTLRPEALVDRLAHATAWGGNGAPVVRLYAASFVRTPDTGGVTYWIKRRRAGVNLNTIASNFVGSSEFRNRYGSLDAAGFVDRVFLNVLGRPADPGGKAFWVNKLKAGRTRGYVMTGFSESNEYVTKTAKEVDSILLRLALFNATPSPDDLTRDLALLNGPGYQRLAATLLYGDQYATRAAAS